MAFVERTPTWDTPKVANVQPATFEAEPKEVPRKWKSGLNEIPARLMGMNKTSAWQTTPKVVVTDKSQNCGEVKSVMAKSSWEPHRTKKAVRPAIAMTLLSTGAHI